MCFSEELKAGNKFRVLPLVSKETNPCSKWPQVSGGSDETALSETLPHVQTMFKNLDKEDVRFLTAASFCPLAPFVTTIDAIITGGNESVATCPESVV